MSSPRTADVPILDQQLCFDLYAASRSVTSAYQPGLSSLGLSYEDYVVLLLLWEHPRLTVPQLARHLRIDTSAVPPMLRRMTARGLVVREGEPELLATVVATEKAHALRGPVTAIHCEIKDALGLSSAELRDLQFRLREVSYKAYTLREAHRAQTDSHTGSHTGSPTGA